MEIIGLYCGGIMPGNGRNIDPLRWKIKAYPSYFSRVLAAMAQKPSFAATVFVKP
jgi:hypothetical protein